MMSKILNYVEEDESPLTIRGLINKFYAKSIIGPRGSIHQYIEKTYKVKLYLNNDTDDLGRLCSISGAPKNIAKAWCEVLSILFPKNSECTVSIIFLLLALLFIIYANITYSYTYGLVIFLLFALLFFLFPFINIYRGQCYVF